MMGGLASDPLARQFRQHTGKLSRQGAVTLAGTVFLVAGGYLFKIYVSRELGAQGLGIYALGMTTIAFFSLFATLGLPPAAARFVAIYRGAGEAGEIEFHVEVAGIGEDGAILHGRKVLLT